MRVVAGLIGAVLGTIIGVVIGLLAAIVTTHNDLFGIFFIGICTVPAGALLGSILGAVVVDAFCTFRVRPRNAGE